MANQCVGSLLGTSTHRSIQSPPYMLERARPPELPGCAGAKGRGRHRVRVAIFPGPEGAWFRTGSFRVTQARGNAGL